MYDPLVSGEINHDAFPLLIVLFLGEYNPKILKVTFPVASSFTIAHILTFWPSTISEVVILIFEGALAILNSLLSEEPW